MKKVLMMAFVAASMLFATSCSKDDDQKTFSGNSLKGTTWAGTASQSYTEDEGTYTVSLSITMKFTTETEGTVSGTMSESFLGQTHSENIPAMSFTYTFDGKTAVMNHEGDIERLTLNDEKTALVGDWDGMSIKFYLQ